MKRRLVVMLAGLLAMPSAQAAVDWSALWRNADQRGQRMLDQGDAASAAKTFTDPRRKAYAELAGGDNAAAARDFAAFDDSDAYYDRGNALARDGKLEDAIKSYDSALERNSHNEDARRNRDLAKKALEQQQQQKQQKQQQSNQDQSGQQGDQQAKQNQQQGQQSDQQAKQDQQQGQQAEQGSSAGQDDKPQGTPKDSEQQQAQRDVDTALKQGQTAAPSPQSAADDGNDSKTKAAVADPATLPVSEQKLAEDQWLRSIPDDPGGLLRRKFMIEHRLREQQQQQQNQP